MSFLKKIFGKTAEAKSPVPRAPRVKVSGLHRLAFVPPKTTSVLLLSNISTSGMAVYHDRSAAWTPQGTVGGSLRIDKEEFTIVAGVRHVTDILAGCEFKDSPAALARAIERYLQVEILALSLQKVNPAYMKADPRGETFWFTDGRQNELFCVADADGIVAFHMSFLGNYVEGGRDKEIKGGIVNERVDLEARNHKGSALIDMDRALSTATASHAATFVQNVEHMPQELRAAIEKSLRTVTSMGPK